ncbi:MAG: cadmium-translocating P-type ATPase, partial [Firmicutes bacterium]|nr:cadmium-translocating P-type ATPase [Bacillota bacterium]
MELFSTLSRRQKRWLLRICGAALLFAAGLLLPRPAGLIPFAAAYLLAGGDVLSKAGRNIVRGRVFDENFLMALATLGAIALAEYPEAVAVMLFYQIGELFQSIAVGRSRRSVAALMDIRPDRATLLKDGQEIEADPEEVGVGDLILVRPGERVPLDGVIVSGSTAVDTSALTGESLPRDLAPGDQIVSGTVNVSAPITVQVTADFGASTVTRVLELVEESSSRKARTENFITRFARWYTPAVTLAAVLLALIPPLLGGGSWSLWLNRALIFLVVSCPCALVISVPLSFFGGIGGASRRGILIKGANFLEALANVDAVAWDKTGTLTTGRFAVTEVKSKVLPPDELLELAARLEGYSNHPLARAVVEAWGLETAKLPPESVSELPGLGVKAEIDGETVYA